MLNPKLTKPKIPDIEIKHHLLPAVTWLTLLADILHIRR